MVEFSTSLVREKIIFTEDGATDDTGAEKEPVIIRSNRVFLKLGQEPNVNKVVIRAQNMHCTLRLAAKILYTFYRSGNIPENWEEQWEGALSDYEKNFNPQAWAAIYLNGKSVFKTQTSPFVDVIEKCALLTLDNYDATMDITESALKQIGHAMQINHASNVAAVFTDPGDSMRCGIIHRTDKKDIVFNFTATNGDQRARIVQSMNATAAYLEAFNLRFTIQGLRDKIRTGTVPKISPENNQIRAAVARQGAINRAIRSFEDAYEVKYRPSKPDFFSEM
jgi:hypothetical protein